MAAKICDYDKIHMFDVDLDNGESWRESAAYTPGSTARLADLPISANWALPSATTCAFPSCSAQQAVAGAEIMSVPAAFTRQTGEAHWEILLRARAIENGFFVIAAAQGGVHEDGRETFGHSMIVDPWGKVLAVGWRLPARGSCWPISTSPPCMRPRAQDPEPEECPQLSAG